MRQKDFSEIMVPGLKYNDNSIQIAAMKALFPQFKAVRKGHDIIEFTGQLQVKPELPVYTVSVLYNGNERPRVKILSPMLVAEPPHFFQKTGTLCLYHPGDFRWRRHKLIAREIMGWTAAWIYFYEVWLPNGDWFGPEADHDLTSNNT
jgi:hypothetical protein